MTSAQRAQLRRSIIQQQRMHAGKTPRKQRKETDFERDVGSEEDEQPLNEMLQTIASNRNKSDYGLLARLDTALAKLRETPQEFGDCEECGEEIPFARLKLMPYAEYCVACQNKRDRDKGPPTRRAVTDYR